MGRPSVIGGELCEIAARMVANDKGLLAIDESDATCNTRFAAHGIAQTGEMRRAYRELILTTPGLGSSISGVILYDETIRQETAGGVPFLRVLEDAKIIPGIKVDIGLEDLANLPHEKITGGLDGLRARLQTYFRMGARFAKWRCVFFVDDSLPSRGCIEANAHGLARYAALCQEAGLVPVVEPEILMVGAHNMDRSAAVTEEVLRTVFSQLIGQGVVLEAMILKPSMVLPGAEYAVYASLEQVATATLKCLLRAVPAAVPGSAFLSGGQTPELASMRLNAINLHSRGQTPWPLTFSFARAIQEPALAIWGGRAENLAAAQRSLGHRTRMNRAARQGDYARAMEMAT